MKKAAEQIATEVLCKMARENFEISMAPEESALLKGVGTLGGGMLGGLFGGAAGSGLGSAIRSFPGQEPTSRLGKVLSKSIQNPVGRAVAGALPYVGLGTGLVTGARKGYGLFDVGNELTDEDVQRILEEYAHRVS